MPNYQIFENIPRLYFQDLNFKNYKNLYREDLIIWTIFTTIIIIIIIMKIDVSVLMFQSVHAPNLVSVSHGADLFIHIHICLSRILVKRIKILPQKENFCLIALESQLFNWFFFRNKSRKLLQGITIICARFSWRSPFHLF